MLSGHKLRERGQAGNPGYNRLAVQVGESKPSTGDGKFSDLPLIRIKVRVLQP